MNMITKLFYTAMLSGLVITAALAIVGIVSDNDKLKRIARIAGLILLCAYIITGFAVILFFIWR